MDYFHSNKDISPLSDLVEIFFLVCLHFVFFILTFFHFSF